MVDDTAIDAARAEIRAQLRAWRELNADRDRLIRRARWLGIRQHEVAEDTGLHRSTISVIAARAAGKG